MSYQSDIEPHLTDMIDLDAFGKQLDIDGVAVVGIFSASEKEAYDFDGLYLDRRKFYCKIADVLPPVTGQQMRVNGERWHVDIVKTFDTFFIAEITRAES